MNPSPPNSPLKNAGAGPLAGLPPGPAEQPSRARYGVLGFLCSLAFVLYIDRVCIGKAVIPIQNELGLSNTQMGYVLGAFTVAYGLFEVPTGRWGDRFGSRGVLTRIVLWWSLFTALTGAATGLAMLVTVRFLFGAGEAGAYPNVARIIARWFPRSERGAAQGFVIFTAQLGGAGAPIVAAYAIDAMGWRATFVAFSLLGVVWAVLFHRWFRDDPAQHPAVNAAERTLIAAGHAAASAADGGTDDNAAAAHATPHGADHPPIPWRAILSSSNVWLLGTLQTCSSFLSYMFMGWYPTYLEKARGVSSIEAGQLASLVLLGSAVGCLASGYMNDFLARVTHDHPARFRVYGFCGTLAAAGALLVSIQCESALATSLWAAVAFMAAISQQATFWAVTTEIGGSHLGVVFGLMNSMGVPGAFVSSVFLGRFVDWMGERGASGRGQWDPAFYVYAAVLVVGACCWLAVDATKKIPDREE
ncbi:MAG: MFS transporter [Pirellulales bacterium]